MRALPVCPCAGSAGPGWRELLERCWAEDPEQRPDFRCDTLHGAALQGWGRI